MKKRLKLIVVLSVIAAFVFAAGCAEEPETTENETQAGSEQVTPVTPETPSITGETVTEANATQGNQTIETGQIITEAENGRSISIKNGEIFILQLRENPSTGYSWELNVSEGLNILSDGYTEDEAPENQVGVPGTHSWTIEAASQGSQQVNGIYKRPWENMTGTEENFTLNVEVF
ncbi:protease inhibitor I42 family protein [Methanosarcina hadiensis]|uniref:protease inhibitor I42 family protein n=1 Tax=Methanosarcina hadiensis TaxID=3078083 RepID=UPI0039773356